MRRWLGGRRGLRLFLGRRLDGGAGEFRRPAAVIRSRRLKRGLSGRRRRRLSLFARRSDRWLIRWRNRATRRLLRRRLGRRGHLRRAGIAVCAGGQDKLVPRFRLILGRQAIIGRQLRRAHPRAGRHGGDSVAAPGADRLIPVIAHDPARILHPVGLRRVRGGRLGGGRGAGRRRALIDHRRGLLPRRRAGGGEGD